MSNIDTITREHDNFSSSYDELTNLLEKVITNRKITQDDKYDLEKAHATYTENYNEVKRILEKEKENDLREQIKNVSDRKLDADIKSIVNILTNNGEKTALYLDEDGVLYIDGEKIPELKQTKLIVDEQNGKIESLVSDGFVEDADGNKVKLKVAFSTMDQKVDKITHTVGQIEGVANSANDKAQGALTKVSQVEQTMDGVTTTVKAIEGKVDTANTNANSAVTKASQVSQKVDSITATVKEVEEKANNANTNASDSVTKVSQIKQTVDGITSTVGKIEEKTNTADKTANTALTKASQIEQTVDGIKQTVQGYSTDISKSVVSMNNKFYLSNSKESLIGGSWSTTAPTTVPTGKYLWIRPTYTLKDGTTKDGTAVCTSSAGPKGEKGDPGEQGPTGEAGVGISLILTMYYMSTSKTTAPSIPGNGWLSKIPAYQEGKYLWSAYEIAYTNGTIGYTAPQYCSEWEANHKAEKAVSIATQTSEKFEWIVQKGSTSSSITLTDSLIQAIASSNIQLSAKKILINGLMEGSGWKITDEGELDILDLNVRGNFTCDSLNVDTLISADIPPALSENKTIYVSSGETISQYLDDLPLNLNGFTVEIYLTSNTTENLELRRHANGLVNIFLCGNTIKGTIRSIYNNAKYSIYGGNSTTDTTMGSIMPYTSYNVGSYYYTTIFSDCPNVNLYNLKVYGDSVNSNSVGVGATQKSKVYMENISFVGCKYNCRTYSMTELYCQSSSGLSTGNSWNAGTGAKIVLYPGQQAGGGNNTFTSGNGQIISTGVTFSSSKDSGSNTTTVNPTTTRFETFKPKYADTYRSSVYNNWEGRGKCRQGDWGYGDCNGYWFYGSQFAEVKGKNITKVEIDVTRSSDIGYSASTSHVFQAHTYSGRPSSTPSFYASCNKTLSLAWGKKGTVTITDSTVLNGIKSGTIKGFGIQSTYDKSHYSALSNGTVRIYYTE